MKIKKLSLKNFKGFEGTHEIEFNDSVTAIIGVNGAGKTSVLDAISFFLDLITKRINGHIYKFDDVPIFKSLSLKQNKLEISIQISIDDIPEKISFEYGRGGGVDMKLLQKMPRISDKLTDIVNDWTNTDVLPVILHYQTNRVFIGNGLNQNNLLLSQFSRHDVYTNAFNPNIDYDSILSWYIQQKNIENSEKVKRKDLDFQLSSVTAITVAINSFLLKIGDSFLGNAQVDVSSTSNNLVLFVDKGYKTLEFSQLSSGERMMIGMVLDIAYRMAIANPMLKNPLESTGIILIDELELHLHPKWQSTVLNALSSTFPNVQFIVTTHSPLVINHLQNDQLVILDDFKITQGKDVYNTYGRDVNSIIEDFMGGLDRPLQIKELINEIEKQIDESQLEKAEKTLQKLKSLIDPNDYKISELDTIIAIDKDEID